MSAPASSTASARSRLARAVAIFVGTLLVIWVLFELVCRVVDLPKLTLAELDPLTHAREQLIVQPHPYLGYANKPGYAREKTEKNPTSARHNSFGFRGPETTWNKPDGVWRVFCMGGSSTYGLGPTSDETNWTARLEAHLNAANPPKRVEVINGGCQGWSTHESLINLSIRGVNLQPDLVLVYQTFNDMRCALYPGVKRDNTHWRAVWPVERPNALVDALENSYAFLAWRRYGTNWWETYANLSAWAIVDVGKYKDNFAQPTDIPRGMANYQRNLVTIIALAHAHGAEVLLTPECMRMSDFDLFSSGPQQRAAFEEISGIVERVASERSVPFCDARSVLEREADRQRAEKGSDTVFTREVHLTDEGCDLLARTLSARILELGLIQ
jgi:lysophospholipase L1-like esterase